MDDDNLQGGNPGGGDGGYIGAGWYDTSGQFGTPDEPHVSAVYDAPLFDGSHIGLWRIQPEAGRELREQRAVRSRACLLGRETIGEIV